MGFFEKFPTDVRDVYGHNDKLCHMNCSDFCHFDRLISFLLDFDNNHQRIRGAGEKEVSLMAVPIADIILDANNWPFRV